MLKLRKNLLLTVLLCWIIIPNLHGASDSYFKIRIVDEETGRGIPLVQVRTQNYFRYYSDSNGLVAFKEPGLMDQDLYLFIESEGYEYPKDIMGNSGFVINAARNDSIVVKMKRRNIAERLYRITGQGIYRDSDLLGAATPLKNPLLSGKVLGQDSNLRTIYKNRIFWFWGDTFKPAYPWGNFSVSGAVSLLPKDGGLPPEKGIDLDYFVDSAGFSKPMIKLDNPGFVWLDWVIPVKNDRGEEQLVTKYARVRSDFTNHERGIAIYDEQDNQFKKYKEIDAWIDEYHTTNHAVQVRFGDKPYLLMTSQFEFSRIEPDLDRLSDPNAYEYFSCLKTGAKYNSADPDLDRDQSGELVWGWKRNTDPIGLSRQNEMVRAGKIAAKERWFCFDDIITGNPVDVQRGSIYFNQHRKCWILIIQKNIGEIWYAEADTPVGPWIFGVKVLEHNQFFYNPVHHPFFDQENGRIIYFEGTYTNSFSGYPTIVPGYEYNQLMYRLDLNDKRLSLPVMVYQTEDEKNSYRLGAELPPAAGTDAHTVAAFLAFEPGRHYDNMIPVYREFTAQGTRLSLDSGKDIMFYALPAAQSPFEKFTGAWRCNMTDGVFMQREFNLRFSNDNGKLSATVKDAGYTVQELLCVNDSIDLSALYVDKIYHFAGRRDGGKIAGTWKSDDGSSKGTWQAQIDDHQWQFAHTPGLTGLYEYRNSISGAYFYSTDEKIPDSDLQRTKNPVCRVWAVPTNVAAFDFNIKPDNID